MKWRRIFNKSVRWLEISEIWRVIWAMKSSIRMLRSIVSKAKWVFVFSSVYVSEKQNSFIFRRTSVKFESKAQTNGLKHYWRANIKSRRQVLMKPTIPSFFLNQYRIKSMYFLFFLQTNGLACCFVRSVGSVGFGLVFAPLKSCFSFLFFNPTGKSLN